MKKNPAEYAISVFGGLRKLARAIKRDPSAVCKWRKPKILKGTGGQIPRGAQHAILRAAKARGYDITTNDILFGR